MELYNEMRIAKMKCCQGNMNFQAYILLIMDAWPVNVRIFVVSAYVESKSVVQTQRRFRREFKVQIDGRIPSRKTIVSWFNMFYAAGNLQPSFHGSGR